MYLDSNGCERSYHEIKKVGGKWTCLHSDGSECEESEYDVSDVAEAA